MLAMTIFWIVWCFIHTRELYNPIFKLLLQDQYASIEKIELFDVTVFPEVWFWGETSIKFKNCVLIQENHTFTYQRVVDIYLLNWPFDPSDNSAMKKALFGAVKFTKIMLKESSSTMVL